MKQSAHPRTLHTATNQSHSKSIGLQLNRWCQRWRKAFMRGVSKRAKRNSTRSSGISGDTLYLLVARDTAGVSFVDYGPLSSGMQL